MSKWKMLALIVIIKTLKDMSFLSFYGPRICKTGLNPSCEIFLDFNPTSESIFFKQNNEI